MNPNLHPMRIQRKDLPSFASCFECPTLPIGIHAQHRRTFPRWCQACPGRGPVRRCGEEEDVHAACTCRCQLHEVWSQPVAAVWPRIDRCPRCNAIGEHAMAPRALCRCSIARIRPSSTSQASTSVVQTRPSTRRGCARIPRNASWRWRHVADARSRCSTWTARSRSRGRCARWRVTTRRRSQERG